MTHQPLHEHGNHLEPHIQRLHARPLEQIPKLFLDQLHLRGEHQHAGRAGGVGAGNPSVGRAP
jgi:hypothetical protein